MLNQTTTRAWRQRRRVFIVDDHPIVRHGITHLINQQKDLMVCGEADSQHTALPQIAETNPDGVIVNLMQRRQDGLALIKQLRVLRPQLPVLVFSIHEGAFHVARVLRAGASGYLHKRAPTDKVLSALRTVLNGEKFFPFKAISAAARNGQNGPASSSAGVKELSCRQREVLRLLGNGNGTREIARVLGLSRSTVEGHRRHIKRKLALQASVELIQYATRWVEAAGHC
jgi:DNA-binding NarL/FixJ family response regulator